MQVPSGFSGAPDDKCDTYKARNLVYTVFDFVVIPKRPEDIYGAGSLILLVRAADRWGTEPHQCRLDLANKKAKDALAKLVFSGAGVNAEGWSRGAVTFSFGAPNEAAKVTVEAAPPDEKGPPDVPATPKSKIFDS